MLNMRKVHVKRFTYPNVKEQDTGNYSIITKGREQVCKKCARCCKQFRWYIDESMALRAMYLDAENVWVEEHQLGNRYVYVLVIDAPCQFLKQKEDGTYYCELYKTTLRPWDCKMYPDNIPVHLWEIEQNYCPLVREALKKIRSKR